MRPAGRSANQVRPVTLTRNYTKHAEGSVLVEFGDTKVLCTASIDEGVPRFLKGQGEVCNFKRSRSDRCLVDFLTILTDGYFGVSDGNATNNRSVAALRIRQHPVICSKAEAAVVQTGKETTCRDQLARRELAAIFG